MNWKQINFIDNVISVSYDSFERAIMLGLIVYYDQNSKLQILNSESFEELSNNLEVGSTYYEVAGKAILFKFNNEFKRFNIENIKFEDFCITSEENIKLLSPNYCLGSTSKRNPKIRRLKVISILNNKVLYEWEDDKELIFWRSDLQIFQTKFKGNLYSLNINNNVKIWELTIDEGIPGRRYLKFLENNELLVQKYFSVDYNCLLKINLSTGSIVWEIEQTFPFYSYDESTHKLYGLGGNFFEVINVDTGEREMKVELNENLHIPSHLTYYTDGLLYFSGYKDNNLPVFGAVNVECGDLTFTQEVEMQGEKSFRKGLERPIVVGNRLYIKDSMKTLHVFENSKSTETKSSLD